MVLAGAPAGHAFAKVHCKFKLFETGARMQKTSPQPSVLHLGPSEERGCAGHAGGHVSDVDGKPHGPRFELERQGIVDVTSASVVDAEHRPMTIKHESSGVGVVENPELWWGMCEES